MDTTLFNLVLFERLESIWGPLQALGVAFRPLVGIRGVVNFVSNFEYLDHCV